MILGRAGSKGLPGKNTREVAGRACASWTIGHALDAMSRGGVERVCVSTDCPVLAGLARDDGVAVVERPAELASDTATVDAAARHALLEMERRDGTRYDAAVILYANVPVRPGGGELIIRALERLADTGADSVQSYTTVGKHHPWWTAVVGGDGRVRAWDGGVLNHGVFRRQDLAEAHVPDGGVLAVTRAALMLELPGVEPGAHAFFGADRRGIVTAEGSVVDIDAAGDAALADALIRTRRAVGGFAIAGRAIGAGHEPYVIAEIGVNHDGLVSRAQELVDAAAEAGADAVKFQYFRAEMLMSRGAMLASYQSRAGERDAIAMLARLELDLDQLSSVVERARRRGVHAIVSVFSEPLVRGAETLGWDAYKVASPDIVNRPLLRSLLGTGRPLILSTGASTLDEVTRTLAWMERERGERAASTAVLQCVSSYPTQERCASLAGIGALREATGLCVGYSDHTESEDTGSLAVAAGAYILEKHLTHSRGANGPDHAASLEPDQFARYVRAARRAHAMMGLPGKAVLEIEQDVRRASRQSVVAARAIAPGQRIGPDDIACKRPGTGISAWAFDGVLGRVAARAIAPDVPITQEDLA